MKRFNMLFFVLTILVLLATTAPIFARSVVPAFQGPVAQTGNVELDAQIAAFVDMLIKGVIGLVTLGFAAPLTVLLTNILKSVIPDDIGGIKISGSTIHLVLSVIIWIAYAALTKFGYGAQFETGVDILFKVLSALAPLFGLQVTGQAIYDYSANRGVKLWGYRRTVPTFQKYIVKNIVG